MAGQLSEKDKLGKKGEVIVHLLAEEMGASVAYIPAGEKTPSIDGILQIHDHDYGCKRCINVQIKTGNSHVKTSARGGPKLTLNVEDIREWKSTNDPTIIVWVAGEGGSESTANKVFWRNAQYAKINARGVRFKASNKFDKGALPHLLKLAREHAGITSAPLLSCRPLFPDKVKDVKERARKYYDEWRREGARNPLLKDIKITLKGWRHITRAELSQSVICHRLSLLPCAKEIISTSRQIRFMRRYTSNGRQISVVRLTGALKEKHRVAAVIDVVLEKEFADGARRAEYTFLSVYERRHI